MNGTVRIAITQGYSEGDYVTSQTWASDQRAVGTDADRPLLERACLDKWSLSKVLWTDP